MNLADLRAQLETDLAWRQDEIRFFQNRGAGLQKADEQDQYRRALVLLLYSHFEGFCKFSLSLYVDTINSEKILCGEATFAIAAAALADVFKELREATSKCAEFKHSLPEDAKLHKFARDREFIERAEDLLKRVVQVPDHVVDTESNLKPVVLRKNLYRVGLPHDQFEAFEDKINRLLAFRNRIAHGESRRGVDRVTYEDLRAAVFSIMEEVTRSVTDALQEKRYLRAQLGSAVSAPDALDSGGGADAIKEGGIVESEQESLA